VDAFKWFDKVTLEGAAVIRAVGHMNWGRQVWAIAERPDAMEIFPGEEVRQHLILTTSHDGSSAVKVRFNPYRVSTGTPLAINLGRKIVTEVRVRHTKSMQVKLDTVEYILAAGSNFFDRWRAAVLGDSNRKGLKNTIVTQDDITRVVEGLFPNRKKIGDDGSEISEASAQAETARELLRTRIAAQAEATKKATEAASQPYAGVSAFDVFLGASDFVANDRKPRKEGNAWVASVFGSGTSARQSAWDLVCSL